MAHVRAPVPPHGDDGRKLPRLVPARRARLRPHAGVPRRGTPRPGVRARAAAALPRRRR
jgi:hypothetical protein